MRSLHPDLRSPEPAGLGVPVRALAVGAHPDDIEFGAGATLAWWADEGCELVMVIITDGSKGTWDRDLDPVELAATRREEQQVAAEVLGAAEVVFLGHVDGMLEPTMGLRAEMSALIRRVRPQVVLTHDPWQRYQLHPDHRAAGITVVDGVVAARDHLFFPEQLQGGLEPHRPETLLLWAADEPNHWQDVAAHLDRKIAALRCHASQRHTTMGGGEELEKRIRDRAATLGEAAGLDAAEAFRRITP